MVKLAGKSIQIKILKENDLRAAATICAHAMLNNPIHIRVFGQNENQRLRRLKHFFPGMLAYVYRKGHIYAAFVEQQMVGVFGFLPPKRCQPSIIDAVRLLPSILRSNHLIGLVRVAIWLSTWAKLDPKEPHWHLGPLAVDPQWQQLGIGTQLFSLVYRKNDGIPLYLETDTLNNAQYYEKFGFSTVNKPTILGQPCWIMLKKPCQ